MSNVPLELKNEPVLIVDQQIVAAPVFALRALSKQRDESLRYEAHSDVRQKI